MVSILEFVLSFTAAGDGSGGGLSAFRAFRILRVLKLINSWSSLKDFITVLFGTIKELGNFCLIVILVGARLLGLRAAHWMCRILT